MKSVLKVPQTKYKLVVVEQLFKRSHKKHNKYLHDNNITNKSAQKKLFYHTYILDICEAIIKNNNTFSPVLLYNSSNSFDKEEAKLYDKFLKILPVLNYSIDTSYEEFEKDLQDIGFVDELLSAISLSHQKNSKKTFYFSKIQKFCERYELTFLDKKFFSDIKNKMSLI